MAVFSTQYIDLGVAAKSSILSAKADYNEKVSKDTFKLKISKIHSAYNIPYDETIIAYCKGTVPLFGITNDGIIFTDKAFYPFPKASLGLSNNRILYTDLSKYIITREYDNDDGEYLEHHSGLMLRKDDQSYKIYDGTIFAKNVAAKELYIILTAIQEELCLKNPEANALMHETFNRIFSSYKNKLRKGTVTKSDNNLLRTLMTNEICGGNAALLLAEYTFRLCDKEKYREFLNNASVSLSKHFYVELLGKEKEFTSNFIRDLQNVKPEISDGFIKRITDTIEERDDLEYDANVAQIYVYALICLNRYDLALEAIGNVKRNFGDDIATPLEIFMRVKGHILMKRMYLDIKTTQSISPDLINVTDGLGLTALHYALILDNEKAVDKLLDETDWINFTILTEDEEISDILNLSILACMKQSNLKAHILCYSNAELKAMHEAIEALEAQIKEGERAVEHIKQQICNADDRMRRMKRNGEPIDDILGRIEDMKNSRYEAVNALIDCREEMNKLKDEFSEKGNEFRIKVLRRLKELSKSDNAFVRFMLSLYENIDVNCNLEKLHASAKVYKIIDQFGFIFVLPEHIDLFSSFGTVTINDDGSITISYVQNKNTSNQNTGNWFSKEAYTNPEILASEFRALAKKYHPDVCEDENANRFFSEISQEHERILKQFE